MIRHQIGTRPLREDDMVERLNREVIPVVRATRGAFNRRHGNLVEATENYIVHEDDEAVLVDATAGAVDVILPLALGWQRELKVKKVDSSGNAVSVLGSDGDTIDGAASKSLPNQWDSVRLISDGENWLIF